MYLSKEYKAEIFAEFAGNATNTGSAEGQVALFTKRIAHLTEHLKNNRKDFSTQRALQKLVGKRRALLAYLYKTDIERYRAIIKALGLRDIIK
jgi:small subunit ribosomal protein S15